MFLTSDKRYALSSWGWQDKGGVHVLDVANGSFQVVPIGQADYVRLYEGSQGLLSVAHMFRERDRVEFSVHREDPLLSEMSRVIYTPEGLELRGDPLAWASVPRHFVFYWRSGKEYQWAVIDPDSGDAAVRPVEWFDDRYDHGYPERL
jgi:hypothetical protein